MGMINELRVGNIVNKKFDGEFQWSYFRAEEFTELEKYPDIFAPIDLTKEWLDRFGAVKSEDEGIFEIDGLHFRVWNGVVQLILTGTLIRSVHQLQNAYFEITRKELKV